MNGNFFLAANSADGFYSVFNKCFDAKKDWLCYIIKGGPGTGKSSFMRCLYNTAISKNIPATLCMCSSDPDSLDAVIFPTLKKVIMDGTAPHTVDPKFPAICEQIINTGEFWNAEALQSDKQKIIALIEKNSAYHKIASSYIKAAGRAFKDNFSVSLSATDIEKCIAFAVATAEKNIPITKNRGYSWVRFLGGITPKGIIHYTETVNAIENKIIIRDEYGAAASIILSVLRDIAVSRGYETIIIKNELLPTLITDAIIIPKLHFAVCRETSRIKYDSDEKRVHASRFTDTLHIKNNKQKMAFNKKLCQRLLESAVDTLKAAKATHDKLEEYYVGAMDFTALSGYYNRFEEKFFA